MILFLNVSISDAGSAGDHRGLLGPADRVDVFKYSLASLATISWGHVIIYYDLAENYARRRAEIDAYIAGLFPSAMVYHHRNERQAHWETALETVFAIEEEDLVWCCCDAGYVFIDYELDLLAHIEIRLEELAYAHRFVSCYLAHWQEALASVFPDCNPPGSKPIEITKEGFVTLWSRSDGVQIVNKRLLRHWWFAHDYGEAWMPQPYTPDGPKVDSPPNIHCLIPRRELVRHFDGYSQAGIDFSACPPLFIPQGFFEQNIRILYGADSRKPGFVHMNPLISNYAAASSDGVDLRGVQQDIPVFWRSRIKTVEDISTADASDQQYHRDLAILKSALALYPQLPAGFVETFQPALRTTDAGLLSQLSLDADEFVNAVSSGDNKAFSDTHDTRPCLECLERVDHSMALQNTFKDYLNRHEADANRPVEPFGLSPVDTWTYFHLLAQLLRCPNSAVDYTEVEEAVAMVQATKSESVPTEVASADSGSESGASLLAIPFGPCASPRFALPASSGFHNVPQQLASQASGVEYSQLLAAVLPSVALTLNKAEVEFAEAGFSRAEATLNGVLSAVPDAPLEFAATLCCLASLRWIATIFASEHQQAPVVRQAFRLLRDLNCRRMAQPEVQQALVRALNREEAEEQARVYNRLGEALFALEQLQGAESAYLQALALAAQSASVHNNLAVLYWQTGKIAEAKASLQAAMQLTPSEPDKAAAMEAA